MIYEESDLREFYVVGHPLRSPPFNGQMTLSFGIRSVTSSLDQMAVVYGNEAPLNSTDYTAHMIEQGGQAVYTKGGSTKEESVLGSTVSTSFLSLRI